jgi:hypothetical protein
MKKILIVLVAIFSASCSDSGKDAKSATTAVLVEPAGTSISVNFPGDPTFSTTTINVPVVGKMKMDTYKYTKGSSTFSLQIAETLDTDISGDSLFDSVPAIQRNVTKSGAEILDETETSTLGYDTYLISSARADGGTIYQKFVKVENQQYTLSIYYRDGQGNPSEINQFFDSLSVPE